MTTYLLMLHEDPSQYDGLAPADIQRIIERYSAWSRDLAARGLLVGGEKLADEGGKQLRRVAGTLSVTDGPYAEAKEVIGGYFVIQAPDEATALAIAAECPHLDQGWIALRRIEAV
jgi:hypothetical protein